MKPVSGHPFLKKVLPMSKLGLSLFLGFKDFFFSFLFCIAGLLGFPGGSDGKESTCNAGELGLVPGLVKIPWRRTWQPTPVFLPGEAHGQRSLAGCSPWGRKESDTTERLSTPWLEWLSLKSPQTLLYIKQITNKDLV